MGQNKYTTSDQVKASKEIKKVTGYAPTEVLLPYLSR